MSQGTDSLLKQRMDAATKAAAPYGGWSTAEAFAELLLNGLGIVALPPDSVPGGLPTTDSGITQATSRGLAGVPFQSADQSGAAVQCSDAPATGLKLVLTDLIVSVDTAMTVTFTEQTSGTVVHVLYMAANSVINLVCRGKVKLAAADKYLEVQTSVAGNISVEPIYYSEA